jgi:hypothetical protein
VAPSGAADEAPPPPGPPAETEPEDAPPPTSISTPGGGGVEVAAGRASWECPVCGEHNPIEANICPVCQTPFARLFQEAERGPLIEPRTAALWSLAFAGLGHWKAGLRVDGAARIVLFSWTLGTVLVLILSRSDGGFGRALPLFVLYLSAAAAIYVLSVIDAHRVCAGQEPLVSSRVLLWACAALLLLSVALATLVTLPATRG